MSFFHRSKPETPIAPNLAPALAPPAASSTPSMGALLHQKQEENRGGEAPQEAAPAQAGGLAVEHVLTAGPAEQATAPMPSPQEPQAITASAPPTPLAPAVEAEPAPNEESKPAEEPPAPPEPDAPEGIAEPPRDEPNPDSSPLPKALSRRAPRRARMPPEKPPAKKKARSMAHKPAKLQALRPPAKPKAVKARAVRRTAPARIRAPTLETAAPEPKAPPPQKEPAQLGFPSNVEDSRRAFVVLAWFEFLLKRIPVSELPYLIDQYRKIGWIDDALHAWFIQMAQGVGGTRTKAGETQFARQGARGLVTIHKETLRFLRQLRAAPPSLGRKDREGVEEPLAAKQPLGGSGAGPPRSRPRRGFD